MEQALTREGVHRQIPIDDEMEKLPAGMDRIVKIASRPRGEEGPSVIYPSKPHAPRNLHGLDFPSEESAKGHAHDPLKDTLYLDIGVDPDAPDGHGDLEHPILSESPSGVETNIYEQAYQDEMDRVLQQRGRAASMYLNRRVEHRDDLRSYTSFLDQPKEVARAAGSRAASKLGDLASKTSPSLVDIVKQVKEKTHAEADASSREGSRPRTADGKADEMGRE
jgi:[calcium/calmodulin-dependent protein kinase] kinase